MPDSSQMPIRYIVKWVLKIQMAIRCYQIMSTGCCMEMGIIHRMTYNMRLYMNNECKKLDSATARL